MSGVIGAPSTNAALNATDQAVTVTNGATTVEFGPASTAPPATTSTVRLEVGGASYTDWTDFQLTRSLTEMCGSFRFTYDDGLRVRNSLPRMESRDGLTTMEIGQPVRIFLDDELVFRGYLNDVEWQVSGDQTSASIVGRDFAGDLVDCTAAPEGPIEYKGLTVQEIAARLCAPFGIPVVSELTPDGKWDEPLPDYGLDLSEPVYSAIDKAAKQRAVLVLSDGIGRVVLTRAGTHRAPAPLTLPGNATSVSAKLSERELYSDYWVKGQSRHAHRGRGRQKKGKAALDSSLAPETERTPPGQTTSTHARGPAAARPLDSSLAPGLQPELYGPPPRPIFGPPPPPPRRVPPVAAQPAIVQSGHAVDPTIGRYRPRVWVARTSSGGAPLQVLAEWRMRIARARAVQNHWTVPGWRAGPDRRLWRMNEVVSTRTGTNPAEDKLIEAVTYALSDQEGTRTAITVVGRDAYSQEPLPDAHRRRGAAGRGSNVARVGK